MVAGIAAQVAKVINIPCAIVCIGIQAVFDIPARNFSICAVMAIPQAKIGNYKDWHTLLDIEIHSLIIQLICVQLIHAFHAFVFRKLGILCFQVSTPILVVQISVAPNQVFIFRLIS